MGLPKIKDTALPKKKGQQKERKNPFAALAQYLKDVRLEFRKVMWPTRTEVASATMVVLTTLAFFTVYTGVLDFTFSKMIEIFLP